MTTFVFLLLLGFIFFGFGMLLGVHLRKETFYEGTLLIKKPTADGKRIFSLEMDVDPTEIKDLDIITFKVVEEQSDE